MRKALFTLALFASALTIPLTAHADTIDQFTFTSTALPDLSPSISAKMINAPPSTGARARN
jgi:hypothetical protein